MIQRILAELGLFSPSQRVGVVSAARKIAFVVRWALLAGVAAYVAGPFLTDRAVGTGEALNYSDATADAVVQFRSGVFPVYVGQSEFAFNGRVHPLRTAMLLPYEAILIDRLSGHKLSFWALQNYVLAFSLMGAVLSAYVCIRQLSVSPWSSLLLAALYGLSPGLLAPAYGQDLYMTVVAAPFVPIAILGVIRIFDLRSHRNFALISIGVAGAWLAHPPVAAWLMITSGLAVLVTFIVRRPTLGDLGFVAIAGGLFLVLGGYAFIGSLSLHSDILNKDQAGPPGSGLATIVSTIETSFPKTLQSISDHADTLSDFQLGYGLIALLVMAIIGAVYRRRVVFWIPIGVIGFLVLLLTPVPWLNAFLWGHIPYSLFTLTNVWPMQRLYLLLAGWIIFAVAAIWPKIQIETLPWKHIARILIVAVAAVIWSSVEAWQFIHRGYGTQRDEVTSVRSHWPEYINLTPTAYSMLGIPATYTDGPVEVEHEFRLVRRDDYFPLIDNWQVKSEKPPAAQGRITVKTKIGNALILEPKINLAPGRRYLLTFQFLVPSVTGGLLFRDDVATRSYGLSTSARWRGFGMNPDNRHSLVVWTSAKTETPLEMILSLNEPLQTEWTDFADFTLEEIDRNQLPIKTQLLVPELHCEINSPEAAWLVTPRIHVKGYKASVDGIQARVINSDDGEILIAVPKGKHRVELRYTGFALLNIAFYSCLVGWCCVGSVAFLLAIRGERVIEAAQLAVKRTAVLLWTRAVWIGASAIVITVVFVSWRAWQQHRDAVGPVSMEVWLPMKKDGQTEPLLAVGKSGSGAIVFINYVDTTHIKLGMNVWGGDYVTTEPIEVDFGRPHRFVVTMGALYPQANPHLSGWNGQQLEWFRSKFKLTIDENVALLKTIPSKESSFKDITVGENLIGASVATTEFSGQIISSSRLPLDLAGCPFPSAEQLAKTIGPLQLTARLPTDKLTRVEPLLTTGVAGKGTFVFVNYMDAAHIRIGVDVWNVSLKWSDPIEIDYAKPQVFAISSSALYPPSHSGLKDLSAAQLDHLRNTIDVYHNGKKVFTQPTSAYDSTPEQTNIGVTRIGGSNTDPAFTGEFLDVRRLSIPRISENAISSK